MHRAILVTAALVVASSRVLFAQPADPAPLPGTERLTMEGDIAAQLVEGVDKFLLRKLDESAGDRAEDWKFDFSSAAAYEKSLQPYREQFAKILGVVDSRTPFDAPELVATTQRPALVGNGWSFDIYAVRWPVMRDVYGEGLLLVPNGPIKVADVVAIPDASQTPEQICGLAEGVARDSQFARRLAASGCRVLVPTVINREIVQRNSPGRTGGAKLTNREYLYRPAFEMGRGLIGYEVQKVLAAVDWFVKEAGEADPKIGVIGYGEGGMLALYAKAIDPRIDVGLVSGYFGPRERMWEEPIDRNLFGRLQEYGDGELAILAGKENLIIDICNGPELTLPSEGGAPAMLTRGDAVQARAIAEQTRAFFESKVPDEPVGVEGGYHIQIVEPKDDLPDGRTEKLKATFCGTRALHKFIDYFVDDPVVVYAPHSSPKVLVPPQAEARHARQIHEIERDTQQLLAESPYVRGEFMKKLDTSSVEAYQKSAEEYREFFATQVIGQFDDPLLEPKPRTRKAYDTEKWTGYEVVLDVFPDVIAYGLLLLPNDLKEGERRPVVVCQHGLEGRPQDVIGEQGSAAYSAFAGKLAERGFITFAPQNLYIGKDKFRTLQRKANPLGKTLFSVIVPQHQQICNWLSSLPMVDKDRIAFYGLSYGGKSAMRIPPLVPNYCLSICSADFNEWVWKNASTRAPYSYVWTGEYEIFEWNLGHTFNYAEMAALIAPRPFMVERGMFDGVAPDETVAYEFAKVRHLYEARLKLKDRCEIEFFDGPHKINGVQSYAFLHKHLNWPAPGSAE